MGYKPNRTVYKLDFSGTEYAGLEVSIRSVPLGKLLDWQRLADGGMDGAQTEGLFRDFAAHLVSWNVEDEADQPVPASFEGVCSQDVAFVQAIVLAYVNSV